MSEEEMLSQIKDLINDRKSFISDDEETSEIFKKDINALEQILNNYENYKKIILNSTRIIDKFKGTYIICFDDPLWRFVKRLEKCLKGSDKE